VKNIKDQKALVAAFSVLTSGEVEGREGEGVTHM